MFVNISPSRYNMEESLTTLVYGSRAKTITNNTQKNVETKAQAQLNERFKFMQQQLDLAIAELKKNKLEIPKEILDDEIKSINVDGLKDEEPEDANKLLEGVHKPDE